MRKRKNTTQHVIIAENKKLAHSLLTHLINQQKNINVMAHASNNSELVAEVRTYHPDTVLIDMRIPFIGSTDAPRLVKLIDNDINVIILTSAYPPDYETWTHTSTTTQWLDQDFDFPLAQQTVRAVLCANSAADTVDSSDNYVGDDYVTDTLTSTDYAEYTSSSDASDSNPPLTPREREVAIHIAYGMTNNEIAECLHISTETVKTHVRHILAKINGMNRQHIVSFVYEKHWMS
ncbi:DNA-binding response regulator [Alloscardovia omnicolens]|uniref:response regulator transcription factor n=1 Tax=Alloscardovia omnicolens TaxID=419015 RepID=UPI003A699FB8